MIKGLSINLSWLHSIATTCLEYEDGCTGCPPIKVNKFGKLCQTLKSGKLTNYIWMDRNKKPNIDFDIPFIKIC